ncbi:hypothetical protein ACJX0J_028725 [Zea mays]
MGHHHLGSNQIDFIYYSFGFINILFFFPAKDARIVACCIIQIVAEDQRLLSCQSELFSFGITLNMCWYAASISFLDAINKVVLLIGRLLIKHLMRNLGLGKQDRNTEINGGQWYIDLSFYISF